MESSRFNSSRRDTCLNLCWIYNTRETLCSPCYPMEIRCSTLRKSISRRRRISLSFISIIICTLQMIKKKDMKSAQCPGCRDNGCISPCILRMLQLGVSLKKTLLSEVTQRWESVIPGCYHFLRPWRLSRSCS